jgi:hypothetical protein
MKPATKPDQSVNKRKAKPNASRSASFVWGQPGLYTKFLELCSEQFDVGLNVFESGEARDRIAQSLSSSWPGCTPEKIRIKLRQKPVQQDLEKRDILRESDATEKTPTVEEEEAQAGEKHEPERDADYHESADSESDDSDVEDQPRLVANPLPPDPILRPRPIQFQGFGKEPQGWKLRVPPNVYQFYRTDGYYVAASHIPGDNWILLDWRQSPPSFDMFMRYAEHFPEGDWRNDEVKQQILSWKTNTWRTVVEAPVPYIPDEFRTGGWKELKYVCIPYAAPVRRTATLIDELQVDDFEPNRKRKLEDDPAHLQLEHPDQAFHDNAENPL